MQGAGDALRIIRTVAAGSIARDAIPTNAALDRQVEGAHDGACQGTSAAAIDVPTVSSARRFIAEPGTACTETYLVVGPLRH